MILVLCSLVGIYSIIKVLCVKKSKNYDKTRKNSKTKFKNYSIRF